MAHKFKVGDKVRVIAGKRRLENIGLGEAFINKESVIDDYYHGEELSYSLYIEGTPFIFAAKDLELVKEDEVVVSSGIMTGDDGFTFEEPKEKKYYGHPRFYEILEQMKDLHSRKNHDYAGTSDPLKNLRACERVSLEPFLGVLVRLQDKWSRIEEFVKSGTLMVKGESVIDTLMDNAIYSVLGIILYEEAQKKKK